MDTLINNAGAVLSDSIVKTKDGLEATFALNVMAPFFLTKKLLPALQKSDEARVINMSSATYRIAKPDANDFNSFNNKSGQSRYGTSKLYVILNTQTMADMLKEKGIKNVTINVSHPGAVATKFGQDSNLGFFNNLIYKFAVKVMPAPANGAITNTYLASDAGVANVSGVFFDNKKNQIKPKFSAKRQALAKLLYEYCESILQRFE
ncbi:SDR family NAD(P)-dependent oxidoreductase [Fructobacillus sp. M2-14]|uniref:SDR family NAD(P)-dependent oxidoreductase n=1 Tax=Fructobacillus broussonetiae TaxID=2713173 RepID=A0ABS5QZS3_9LACO|nr:SDR family NAD(P)-dependent oxidoreductase [Fructobacillus broussonetiae]MBS9338165.1 SDR family NAD(P)-dependent oxidoreductase [Fructobacillus broussonetiae]